LLLERVAFVSRRFVIFCLPPLPSAPSGTEERHGRAIVDAAVPFLLRGMAMSPSAGSSGSGGGGVCAEALDLATELIRRFGSLPETAKFHAQLLSASVAQLGNATALVRKRASVAVAALAPVANDELLQVCPSVVAAASPGG
jgi:hypothetical protein